MVVGAERGQPLQHLVNVADQPGLVVVDVYPCGEVHGRNQHQPFLDPAFGQRLCHLRGNVDIFAPFIGVEGQVLGIGFHQPSPFRSSRALRPGAMARPWNFLYYSTRIGGRQNGGSGWNPTRTLAGERGSQSPTRKCLSQSEEGNCKSTGNRRLKSSRPP